MTGSDYTYHSDRLPEDEGHIYHSPASSPPPPYNLVIRRASASHLQGPSHPISTTFRAHQHGTQIHGEGHVTSLSAEAAYAAAMASGMTGVEGLLYHNLPQVPYPGTGYPPGSLPGSPPVLPGFPPLPLPPRSPDPAHLVPQQLPTHTGTDPGSVSSCIHPDSPGAAQQPTSAAGTTNTAASIASVSIATAANITETWTPDQDRYILRLRKRDQRSHQEISLELEGVFQVKRDASAAKERLARLRAWRNVVWRNGEQLNTLIQEQLSALSLSPADHAQLAGISDAVQLQLREMIRQGDLPRDMEHGVLNGQRGMNSLGQKDHGREQVVVKEDDVVVVDVDVDVDGHEATAGNQAEDFEMVRLND